MVRESASNPKRRLRTGIKKKSELTGPAKKTKKIGASEKVVEEADNIVDNKMEGKASSSRKNECKEDTVTEDNKKIQRRSKRNKAEKTDETKEVNSDAKEKNDESEEQSESLGNIVSGREERKGQTEPAETSKQKSSGEMQPIENILIETEVATENVQEVAGGTEKLDLVAKTKSTRSVAKAKKNELVEEMCISGINSGMESNKVMGTPTEDPAISVESTEKKADEVEEMETGESTIKDAVEKAIGKVAKKPVKNVTKKVQRGKKRTGMLKEKENSENLCTSNSNKKYKTAGNKNFGASKNNKGETSTGNEIIKEYDVETRKSQQSSSNAKSSVKTSDDSKKPAEIEKDDIKLSAGNEENKSVDQKHDESVTPPKKAQGNEGVRVTRSSKKAAKSGEDEKLQEQNIPKCIEIAAKSDESKETDIETEYIENTTENEKDFIAVPKLFQSAGDLKEKEESKINKEKTLTVKDSEKFSENKKSESLLSQNSQKAENEKSDLAESNESSNSKEESVKTVQKLQEKSPSVGKDIITEISQKIDVVEMEETAQIEKLLESSRSEVAEPPLSEKIEESDINYEKERLKVPEKAKLDAKKVLTTGKYVQVDESVDETVLSEATAKINSLEQTDKGQKRKIDTSDNEINSETDKSEYGVEIIETSSLDSNQEDQVINSVRSTGKLFGLQIENPGEIPISTRGTFDEYFFPTKKFVTAAELKCGKTSLKRKLDVANIIHMDDEIDAKKSKSDSPRQYLDEFSPFLLEGLLKLAYERPPEPIQYLADWMISNKFEAYRRIKVTKK